MEDQRVHLVQLATTGNGMAMKVVLIVHGQLAPTTATVLVALVLMVKSTSMKKIGLMAQILVASAAARSVQFVRLAAMATGMVTKVALTARLLGSPTTAIAPRLV